jgi:hypothetical protein
MEKCIIVCVFFFSLTMAAGQQISTDVPQGSFVGFAPEKISLKENALWVQLQMPSQLIYTIESPRDSLYAKQTFGRKAWRASKIILIGELATMAFFAAMPEDFSNWNKNFYKNAVPHWVNAFTMPPKMDDDPFMVNYIQHPLGGAIYYNGVRSQGASPLQSFLFSFAESTFFEYFIESVAERPSIQDLIITPIAGSLVGEFQNQATLLMKKNGFNFVEKIAVFIINPMYVIFNGYKTNHGHH